MRIIYMGSPQFAAHALQRLHDDNHDICCVYSQPAKPAGRGKRLTDTKVIQLAKQLGIETLTPTNFSDSATIAQFHEFQADVCVVCAYGLLLPKAILDAPRLGCINIHASHLPRWRGAAPIERAILAGDETTGITIMQMVVGLDCGPILAKSNPITIGDKSAVTLHDELATLGAQTCANALANLHIDSPKSPQDDAQAIYAAKMTKSEGAIDWHQTNVVIARQIRALAARGGAWCQFHDERLKLHEAAIAPPNPKYNATPGTLSSDGGTIIMCGEGALQIIKAQRAGKPKSSAATLFALLGIKAGTQLQNGI